jgi:Transposase
LQCCTPDWISVASVSTSTCLTARVGTVERGATPPDVDGLQRLSERVARHDAPVRAAIESMNGARFVHDRLELHGWQVEIADAQKVKGLAPLACKTDRIDAWVLAELARRDLVPAIWLPDRLVRAERERARWRLHLVPRTPPPQRHSPT